MRIGIPYYFEQWPRDLWEGDADLMRRSGVSTIRMAEFAWSTLEPESGRYDFSLLDEAIALFASRGISTILGTPTPNYPPWLHAETGDLHRIAADGRVIEFGQRQDVCKNHPRYRSAALALVRAMADRYARDPRVVAWQIDNEMGNHGSEACWCPRCEEAFRRHLSRRFGGDIEKLNGAWGTAFWSQRYRDFSEVGLPRDTADRSWKQGQNPGLCLEFLRFNSAVQVGFLSEQVAAIRAVSPGAFITHNFMSSYHGIDSFALASDLDVAALDSYPFYELEGKDGRPSSFPHAFMRGLTGKNHWIMEQATGSGGWDRASPSPEPGRMRLWAFQSIARGADFIAFFRWRAARYGTEQFWHALLPHHGEPGRRFSEFERFSEEIDRVTAELEGSAPQSRVAILFHFESLWALDIQPQAAEGLDLRILARTAARVLEGAGVDYDVIAPRADFSRYELVFAPSLFVCDDELAARLAAYVERGGRLVIGPRSGLKDEHNAVMDRPQPGPLADLAGVLVEDFDAFSSIPDFRMYVQIGGSRYRAKCCAEMLVPTGGADSVASFTDRYYAGRCAAVRNDLGRGTCIYVGTELEEAGLSALIHPLLVEAGIPIREHGPFLESTARTKGKTTYRFYLNHSSIPIRLDLAGAGMELLTGRRLSGKIELEALGVLIVKED